jgi:hypothetical protein
MIYFLGFGEKLNAGDAGETHVEKYDAGMMGGDMLQAFQRIRSRKERNLIFRKSFVKSFGEIFPVFAVNYKNMAFHIGDLVAIKISFV